MPLISLCRVFLPSCAAQPPAWRSLSTFPPLPRWHRRDPGSPTTRTSGPFRRYRSPKASSKSYRCQCEVKVARKPCRARRRWRCGHELPGTPLGGGEGQPRQISAFWSAAILSGQATKVEVAPRGRPPIRPPTVAQATGETPNVIEPSPTR
jgi:hypothetical protein